MTMPPTTLIRRYLPRFSVRGFWALLVGLSISLVAACNESTVEEVGTECEREWSNKDEGTQEVEQLINFSLLIPGYLPASTNAIPDVTTSPPGEVQMLFPACKDKEPQVIGPQVTITETTEDVGLFEPGTSNPPTEEIDILGTRVLVQKSAAADRMRIYMTWKQGDLSISSLLSWSSGTNQPPRLTMEMETEAIKVAESIIAQSSQTKQ